MKKVRDINNDNIGFDNDDMDNINKTYSNESFFLKNLSKELSIAKRGPEEIEKLNFTVSGQVLSPEAKLVYEKIRILNFFAHQYEATTDFVKFNRIRGMIERLVECLDSKDYDYDVVAQIIVHIELELGMNVLLTTVLLRLAEININEKHYKDIDKADFEQLYGLYQQEDKRHRNR